MNYKVFSDSIHGSMNFHPLFVTVLDTPQIQRLRNIKQLGVCYFVFPSASHNRFEHCLGTAFIAGKLFDSLKQKGIPSDADDETWEKWKLCAQIAGLCHDAGHGPFSHTWERFLKKCGIKWTHEEESVRMFEEILNEEISPTKIFHNLENSQLHTVKDVFHHFGFTRDDLYLIERMILGEKNSKHYLFQVICNKNYNVDVDKWEYITRDSFMLNVPIGFDFHRLLDYCCVLTNDKGEKQICYRDKEASTLIEMFLARGKLHDVAYQHAKVKIIEEMLLDALLLANERLKLSDTPVTKLTDHIYQKILYEDSDDSKMKEAKKILKRIENRNLYKCIAQENFQGKKPEFKRIKDALKTVNDLKPYIEDIAATTVGVHMTSANKDKTMQKLVVYDKPNGELHPRTFDIDEEKNFMKLDLKNFERNQILLLYKGTLNFPDSLKTVASQHLKKIIVEESSTN